MMTPAGVVSIVTIVVVCATALWVLFGMGRSRRKRQKKMQPASELELNGSWKDVAYMSYMAYQAFESSTKRVVVPIWINGL